MKKYRLTNTRVVIRSSDNASIPDDIRNYDRLEYVQWVMDGHIPDDENGRELAAIPSSLQPFP